MLASAAPLVGTNVSGVGLAPFRSESFATIHSALCFGDVHHNLFQIIFAINDFYRVAKYDQAIRTLRRAEQTLHVQLGHNHAANLAFLAMSLRQLGQIDESRIALDRLRDFMQDPPPASPSHYGDSDWSRTITSPTFLVEAKALIGDGTSPDDDRD